MKDNECTPTFSTLGITLSYKIFRILCVKVGIFWEGHKIWKNLPLKIWRYWVASNFKWKIFSNFVAFSEYPNFTTFTKKENNKEWWGIPLSPKCHVCISKRLPQLRFSSWLASRLVSVAALYGKRHAARACHHRARLATRNMKEAIKDSN